MEDYADSLTALGIGAGGWSDDFISDSDSDPYAGRSQEEDETAEPSAEGTSAETEDRTEEVEEESAEDAEEGEGGMDSYWD